MIKAIAMVAASYCPEVARKDSLKSDNDDAVEGDLGCFGDRTSSQKCLVVDSVANLQSFPNILAQVLITFVFSEAASNSSLS